MQNALHRFTALALAAAALAFVPAAAGQGRGRTTVKAGPFTRLPDGKPNMQGYWETRVFFTARPPPVSTSPVLCACRRSKAPNLPAFPASSAA